MPDQDRTDKLGELTERLRDFASKRETLEVAQFQFVGFEEIQRAYGERWDAERDKVCKIAEHYLQKRLGANDMLVRGADGFLVVFADYDGRKAKAEAEELNRGLNLFFLGESSPEPMPTVEVHHASVRADDLIGSLKDVALVTPREEEPLPCSDTISWEYQPVWDARREALSQNHVVPIERATSDPMPGYGYEVANVDVGVLVDTDEAALHVSERAMRSMFRAGQRSLIGCPIHVQSLSSVQNRTRLLAAMDSFDRELVRYRVVKLLGLQTGFPRIYLQEVMAMLKRKVPNIAVCVAWNEPDLRSVLNTDPVCIGMVLSSDVLGTDAVGPSSDLLARVRTAAEQAHAAQKPFFVEGPIPKTMVPAFIRAGVDTLASPYIWPTIERPEGVLRWMADKLAA